MTWIRSGVGVDVERTMFDREEQTEFHGAIAFPATPSGRAPEECGTRSIEPVGRLDATRSGRSSSRSVRRIAPEAPGLRARMLLERRPIRASPPPRARRRVTACSQLQSTAFLLWADLHAEPRTVPDASATPSTMRVTNSLYFERRSSGSVRRTAARSLRRCSKGRSSRRADPSQSAWYPAEPRRTSGSRLRGTWGPGSPSPWIRRCARAD